MKIKKYILILFVSIFFVSEINSQNNSSQSFSLDQAVQYALENHNRMVEARLNIEDANAQVQEYTAIGIPKLNGAIDYQYFLNIPTSILPDFISPSVDGRLLGYGLIQPQQITPSSGAGFPAKFGTNNYLSGGLTMSTLVFDFSYLVGLEAARGLRDMTAQQVKITEYELKYNVTGAYMPLLLVKETRKTLEKNIQNLKKTLFEVTETKKAGFVEQLDVDRLMYSLTTLQTQVQNLDKQELVLKNVLKFQMGYPVQNDIVVLDSIAGLLANKAAIDLEEKYDYDKRPELDILRRTEKLNELNVRRLKYGYYPNVTAFFTHQQQLRRNNLFDSDEVGFKPSTIAGLSINIPIFDGFDKKAKIKRAFINQRKFQLQMKNFTNVMDLQIANSRQNYALATEKVEMQRKNLELAQKIYNTTQTKYKAGVGSSLEVTQAERELYNAQGAVISALYEVLAARYEIDKALGN